MNYASILTNRRRACDEGQRAFIRKEEKDGRDMVSGASALWDIPFLFVLFRVVLSQGLTMKFRLGFKVRLQA